MKGRESGMPDESYWDSFFNPTCAVNLLGCTGPCGDNVEFGCGYGSFTIAEASSTAGGAFSLSISSPR